jgi:hypothetical protein
MGNESVAATATVTDVGIGVGFSACENIEAGLLRILGTIESIDKCCREVNNTCKCVWGSYKALLPLIQRNAVHAPKREIHSLRTSPSVCLEL